MTSRRQYRVSKIKVPETDSTGVRVRGMFTGSRQELGRSHRDGAVSTAVSVINSSRGKETIQA